MTSLLRDQPIGRYLISNISSLHPPEMYEVEILEKCNDKIKLKYITGLQRWEAIDKESRFSELNRPVLEVLSTQNLVTLWEILVPASNKTQSFTYEHHKLWDDYVRSIAGGVTILRPGKGEWVCPQGEIYQDRVIPCRVSCTKEVIEKIMDFTITHYNQKAVMAYKIADEVLFKHAAKD